MIQCKLKSGTAEQTAWVPDKKAKLGNKMTVDDGEEVWEVVEVYARYDDSEVSKLAQEYKKHREHSDI